MVLHALEYILASRELVRDNDKAIVTQGERQDDEKSKRLRRERRSIFEIMGKEKVRVDGKGKTEGRGARGGGGGV